MGSAQLGGIDWPALVVHLGIGLRLVAWGLGHLVPVWEAWGAAA